MKIRRFFGKDMREALRLVKEELGSEAVIMSNRKVADGIELVAAYDKEPDAKLNLKPSGHMATAKKEGDKPLPSLSEIIGDGGPDNLRALLEKQAEQGDPSRQEATPVNQMKQAAQAAKINQAMSTNHASSLANPYASAEPTLSATPAQLAAKDEVTPAPNAETQTELTDIRDEIASLRNVLQFQLAGISQSQQATQRPLQSYLCQQLVGMGIQPQLAEQLVAYTPAEANEREAWGYLLKLLANRIHTSKNDILSHSGVVALVGPTGTGKTTTIAKLAARYAQKYGVDQVAMITIDTYRIAAYEQLATYGKIIGCPVRKAQSADELSDVLFQLRHKRLILIDTAGFSQRDNRLISQLETFKQNSGQSVLKYLVAQANTQYSALNHIIDAYNDVKLDGCIITKLDECYSLGEVISCAIERQLTLSYVTDGQQVPEDLKEAEAKFIISTAAKLYKKYGLNHTNGNSVVNAARAV
jgi:flagellar biosynthesis protein FlhF